MALLFRQIIEKFFEKRLRKIWRLNLEYLSLQKLKKFNTNNIEITSVPGINPNISNGDILNLKLHNIPPLLNQQTYIGT